MEPNTNNPYQPQNPEQPDGTPLIQPPAPQPGGMPTEPTAAPQSTQQYGQQPSAPAQEPYQPSAQQPAFQQPVAPLPQAPGYQTQQMPQQPAQPMPTPTPGTWQSPPPTSGKAKKKWLVVGVIGVAVLLVGGVIVGALLTNRLPTVKEAIFEKNLLVCKRSITYADKSDGFGDDTSFQINGKKSSGCSVTVHFGKSTNSEDVLAKLSNTSMTCTIDTKNDPNAEVIFTNPDKYGCKGTMVAAIKATGL